MSDDTAPTGDTAAETGAAVPVITVTRGNPTADEVAVLSVLMAAMGGGDGSAGPRQRQTWARPARRFTGTVTPAMGWGGRF